MKYAADSGNLRGTRFPRVNTLGVACNFQVLTTYIIGTSGVRSFFKVTEKRKSLLPFGFYRGTVTLASLYFSACGNTSVRPGGKMKSGVALKQTGF
jgi:hypothetical protein